MKQNKVEDSDLLVLISFEMSIIMDLKRNSSNWMSKVTNCPMTFMPECMLQPFLAESIKLWNVMAMYWSWLKSLSLEEFVKNVVPQELCLTSNLQTTRPLSSCWFSYLNEKPAGKTLIQIIVLFGYNQSYEYEPITVILIALAKSKTFMLIIRRQSVLHLLVTRRKKNFLKIKQPIQVRSH